MRASWFLASVVGAGLAGASVSATSCAVLDSIPPNECGNGVYEPDAGEQCDNFPPDAGFDANEVGACGAAGTGVTACRIVCGQQVQVGDASVPSVCPEGTVCSSADHICRADPARDGGVPVFEPLGVPIQQRALSLHAGDFNGDGLGDVLAVSSSESTVYLGSSRGLTESFQSEIRMDGANAGQLGGLRWSVGDRAVFSAPPTSDYTSRDDVVFPLESGAAVLAGAEDGTLVPRAYPRIQIPTPFVFAASTFGGPGTDPKTWLPSSWIFVPNDKRFMFHQACGQDDAVLAYSGSGDLAPVHCFKQQAFADLARVHSADLVPSTGAVCPEIAFGFTNDDHVTVFLPCGTTPVFNTWQPALSAIEVKLANGAKLKGGPFVYDMDGDGLLDLVMGVAGGVQVAYGDGTGHFGSLPGGAGLPVAAEYHVWIAPWEADPGGTMLADVVAVGELNGDGLPDFVTLEGVYASTTPAAPYDEQVHRLFDLASVYGESSFIESAAFGDFNGDGLPDVAFAPSLGTPDSPTGLATLHLLLTTSRGNGDIPLLEPHLVSLDAAAFHVTSGDFDGDGKSDVAFGQTPDRLLHVGPGEGSQTLDTLTVVYGDSSAAFQPTPMGQLVDLVDLVATDLAAPVPYIDGYTDLAVTSHLRVDGTDLYNASIITGRPGHVLISPLGLSKPGPKGLDSGAVLAVAPGNFSSSGHLDSGFLASSTNASGVVNGQTELWHVAMTGDASEGLASLVELPDLPISAADAPTVSSAAGAFPLDGGDTDWFFAVVASQRLSGLVTLKPEPGGDFAKAVVFASAPARFSADASGGFSAPHVRVEAGDVDGKTGVDLVVLSGDRLQIYSNAAVDTTSAPTLVAPESNILDFALLPRAGSRSFDLLYATATGVYWSRNLGDGQLVIKFTEAGPAPSLAVADLDGDRLFDVVVASGDTILAYRMLDTAGTALPDVAPDASTAP